MKKSHLLLLSLPYVAMFLGGALNQVAIYSNGGLMPVHFPAHADVVATLKGDASHSVMMQASHVKFLCDWLISNSGVSSIGDWLQEFSADVKIPSLVAWIGLMVRDIFKK